MEAFIAGLLLNLVSSKVYDTIRHGYKKLSEVPAVRKAIATTSEQFAQFDALYFALTNWCDSSEFDILVQRLRYSRLQDITDATLVTSFIQASNFYSENTEEDARIILHAFILAYQAAIYESDEGPSAHGMRDLIDHARTHSGIERIEAQNEQLAAQLAGVQQLLQAAGLPQTIRDVLPSPDVHDQQYQTKVDVARSQLLVGKPETARSILNELEKEIDGKAVSNNLRGRIKGNLGACALALEETHLATVLFREALEYLPDNVKALTNASIAAFIDKDVPQMLRLAMRARQQDQQDPMAAALYLHAQQMSGHGDAVEKTLSDEPWISEDATCTLILADMRLDEHKYEDAEALLRTSILKDNQNPVAYSLLAHVIMVPVQSAVLENPPLPWRFETEILERIERAENALNHAIALLQRRETPAQLRLALLNRSNCYRWTRRFADAIADCDKILQTSPQDPEALHSKAVTLLQEERYIEAIACLEKIPDATGKREVYCPLAYAYLEAGQPAKTVALLQPLEQAIITDYRQIDTVSLLLEAHHKLEHREQVDALIRQLIESKPDDPDALSVIAEQRYRGGDVAAAKTLLRQALDIADGKTRDRVVLRLGRLHYHQNEFSDAAQLFEQVVDTSEDNPLLRQYIVCLVNAKMYDTALKIARSIRGDGEAIPVISEAEALVLEYIHSPIEARDLWLGLSKAEPDDARYIIRAVILNVQLGESASARQLLEGISIHRIQNDAEMLMLVAETRQQLGMQGALALAYQARRAGEDRPELHLAYVHLFLLREDADRPMLEPQEVGVDTTVHLSRSGATKVYLIVEDKPTNHAAGERAPTDPLAIQLLGRRKGDQLTLKQNEYEEVSYEITDIQSKYVYAFQQTLTEFSTWFPGHPALQMVSIENNDFSKLFKMLDERHKLLVQVMQLYREKNLPLGSIAKMVGRTVFDAWAMQVAHRDGRIIATSGDAADNERQFGYMFSPMDVVIDITAVLTICYLEIQDEVRLRFANIYIAQTALDEVRRWIMDAKERSPNATVWRDGDKYFHREGAEESVQREIQLLERIEGFIASCIVVPVSEMLTIGPEAYERMADIVGDSATASMLVAKERNLPLYADDLGLRQLAHSEWQVRGVWSQTVLGTMQQNGILTMEQYYDAVKQLTLANYAHVYITVGGLMHVLRQNNMSPTAEVTKVFGILRGPSCNEDSAVNVVAWLLRTVCLEKVAVTRSLAILDLCLGVLIAGRNGRIMLAKLKRALAARFAFMPIDHYRIVTNIDAWASRSIL